MSSKNAKRWIPWDGAFRAAGEGHLGFHYGSQVWTIEAAKDRRQTLAPFVFRSWIETYTDGAWHRVGQVVPTTEEPKPPEIVK